MKNSYIFRNNALESIKKDFQDKSILILGYGKEGISSYLFFRKLFPKKKIGIADQNESIVEKISVSEKSLVEFHVGQNFLEKANSYDVIFKSPGISLKSIEDKVGIFKLNSQTNLFLQYFSKQTIGITGTKGKSTSTFLTFETLRKKYSDQVLLAGNMGIPFFDIIEFITDKSLIVCELSSHQLQQVKYSPHISVLLNVFQEHLDHYHSYEEYIASKFNIVKFQNTKDYFIYSKDNELVANRVNRNNYLSQIFPYSIKKTVEKGCYLENDFLICNAFQSKEEIHDLKNPLILKGLHNLSNSMAVTLIAKILGIENTTISKSISTFAGLPHRLEYIGNIRGIHFYNDSISTIPETAMMAINSLENVSTIILGGFDRGIDYHELAVFLQQSNIKNIAFTGDAGERIKAEMLKIKPLEQQFISESDYSKIIDWCFRVTPKDSTCLLSPAAASFDQFKNFEERGNFFRKLVFNYKGN